MRIPPVRRRNMNMSDEGNDGKVRLDFIMPALLSNHQAGDTRFLPKTEAGNHTHQPFGLLKDSGGYSSRGQYANPRFQNKANRNPIRKQF